MQAEEIDNCFDDLLNIEETFVNEGRKEGMGYGEIVGLEDGRLLGLEKGFEFGEELGSVYGSTIIWKNILAVYPEKYSKRLVK